MYFDVNDSSGNSWVLSVKISSWICLLLTDSISGKSRNWLCAVNNDLYGFLFIQYGVCCLWIRTTCEQCIQWNQWCYWKFRLVFIPRWSEKNSLNHHEFHTTTRRYWILRKFRMQSRSFQKSQLNNLIIIKRFSRRIIWANFSQIIHR